MKAKLEIIFKKLINNKLMFINSIITTLDLQCQTTNMYTIHSPSVLTGLGTENLAGHWE